MQTFSELPISDYVKRRLASAGFSIPTPVQSAAIPRALEGSDVLATAQTGTGKTLAFLIPIVEHLLRDKGRGISALILLPTRELAMQVAAEYDALRDRRLAPAALAVGGMPEGKQLSALRRGARLMVATPGRLEDFLGRGLVQLRDLKILVLDEADRMLDMGFHPAIRRIVASLPQKRQTLCFSATIEASVAPILKGYLRHPVRLELDSVLKPAENVHIQAYEVSRAQKQELLQSLLAKETGRCLVFARTRRGAERLAKNLNSVGIAAARIHGDRTQSQRVSALSGFQSGRFRVLIATDVASRGIHVEDIAHVINYDLPEVAENFIHRVGRTGRAGRSGLASTFFAADERAELLVLERTLGLRMERLCADELISERRRTTQSVPRRAGITGRSQLTPLPGEFLQTQMGN